MKKIFVYEITNHYMECEKNVKSLNLLQIP